MEFSSFLLTLSSALCVVGLALLGWGLVRGSCPRPFFIDSMLIGGSVLVIGIQQASGDPHALVALGIQALLLGLFFGRLWGRREATGRASPFPEP